MAPVVTCKKIARAESACAEICLAPLFFFVKFKVHLEGKEQWMKSNYNLRCT